MSEKKRKTSARFWVFSIGVVLVVAVGVVWFFHYFRPSHKEIRNVVLISIDTCRADYLSCYGYPRQTTPNIDAIAAEGVLFENAITPVPLTLPGHSSMLTGTIPPYHGVHDNYNYQLGQSNVTLAEIMRQNGYQTAAVVGAFVMDSAFGLDQGFDTYNDRFDEQSYAAMGTERRAEEVSRYAVNWLQEHHSEPFFMFLHYFDPHWAYAPPEPFASTFWYNTYAGEIAYVDQCISAVIRQLKRLRLYDSALIIITSDHGEMLGEHGEPTHSYFIYQSAVKVPLIFKLPGRRKAKRIKELVGIIDIVPTICGLLDIKAPRYVQGKDLSSCLQSDNLPDRQRHLYCETMYPTKYKANSLLGVVNNRFKYIQTTRPELYDLIADPQETRNLTNQQPRQARVLQNRLKQILQESIRRGISDNNQGLDESARQRLESLGYVAGSVSEDFEFDQSKEDPKDLVAFNAANAEVFVFISEKNYAQAKALCEKMLAQRPDYDGTYRHLSRIAEEQGNYEKAVEYLVEAAKLNPEEVQILKKLAALLINQGRLEEACEHLAECLRLRPDDANAHINLGNVLQLQGKLDEAVSHYRQTLRIKPDYAKAHKKLADVLTSWNEFDEAVRHYTEAIRLNPNSVSAHHNLGKALQSQGKIDESIVHFTKAVELDPNSAAIHYTLAQALAGRGRTAEAVTHFTETLRVRPDWVRAMNSLAWLLATHSEDKFRNPPEAVRLAQRACELTNYKNAGFVDTLAAAYAAAGRFLDAVAAAEEALEAVASTGNKERAGKIQNRLELYRQQKPYRQSSDAKMSRK